MLNFLQRINKTFLVVTVALLVCLAALLMAFNNFAIREAMESGLPKRNLVQFIGEEFENFISKTFLGEASEAANKRAESKKETLKKLGKTVELSSHGRQVKRSLLRTPVSKTGGDYLLHKTDNLTIYYIEFPDLFHANILSEPIEKYQKETEQWFLSKGFSTRDLCGLGINFILDRNLRLKVGYPIDDHLGYCK